MKENDRYKVHQSNGIAYCVNYRGEKIKPYKNELNPSKRKIDWDNIVSYAIVFCIGILAITSTTIMILQQLN